MCSDRKHPALPPCQCIVGGLDELGFSPIGGSLKCSYTRVSVGGLGKSRVLRP